MKIKIFVFTVLLSGSLFAQSAGNTGLSFLKIGFGARNIAMSDLGVASAKDVTALNYNPAMLAKYPSPQLMVTHSSWIQDVNSELLGASMEILGLPMALGVNTTSISGLEVRLKPGEAQSTFNVHYFFGSLSTGFEVYENLALGATVKYLYEGMFSDNANGWAFDFGLYYSDIIENLHAGFSYRNLGAMTELRSVETKLPADLRFGLAYDYRVESIKSDVQITGGFQKYTDTEDNHRHIGTEIFYDRMFAVRAGYATGYEAKGLSAGVGFLWNSINIDYAYTPFDYGLGNAHTISVMYSF
ncbi:MAG: PorV/PorQ family protein [Melioribacteraceae bacterium]|nr:PorV/PorQ family protein [Melioribacteraceae bacterium]MCF8354629.1 PorV/PorQ family protein [Melioribacteraceae bacterium]MCF8395017.1 PorV/PorQ family protein [Melioribacteraceae bacterium]MCF8418879.1 PorV/PorQ family protein [Melioribacteraceae bacterium]